MRVAEGHGRDIERRNDGFTAKRNAAVEEAKILGGCTELGIELVAMPSVTSK